MNFYLEKREEPYLHFLIRLDLDFNVDGFNSGLQAFGRHMQPWRNLSEAVSD